MKKQIYFLAVLTFACSNLTIAQCPMTSAVADVTLQCSGGTGNRTGVAFNPNQQLYYSVNAGSGSYPIETFAVTGGSALSSTPQVGDYRGFWWNSNTGTIEGNTYNGAGIYRHDMLTGSTFYAAGTASNVASSTMPNAQSMGHADIPNNLVIYYEAGSIYKYSRSNGSYISSVAISGLPVSTGNLNVYAIAYSGVAGSEAVVYDYVNKRAYFINYTTGAYVSTCQLPSTAPAASAYMLGFANNRLFLYNSSSNQWYGYPILSNSAVAPSASPAVICNGGSAVLSNSSSVTYTWSNNVQNNSITVSPNVTTSYTVTGTNSAGCVASAVITVTVSNGAPSLTLSPLTASACLGQSVTLSALGAITYTWSNGVVNGVPFAPSTTTTYIVTGQNGCGTTTASINVPVAPLPVLANSSSSITCAGKPVVLTAITSASSFTWLPVNQNTGSVSVAPLSPTSYTVIASNGTCQGTATLAVAVNPVPTLAIVPSSTAVCANSSVTMTVTGADTFTWTQGGYTTAVVEYTPTTATLYTVTGTNSLNCSTTAYQVVITAPSPSLSATASQTLICSGDPVTLNAYGNSASYSWSSGGTSSTENVNPTSSGSYVVTGTSTNNCTSTTTVAITVFVPTVNISGPSAVCSGATATLTASGADSFNWAGLGHNAVIHVTPTVPTTYSLTASTQSDNVTCSTTSMITVNVNATPVLSIAATSTALCRNETTTLTASGSGSYVWSTNASQPSITFSSSATGNFTRAVTGTDGNGCTGTTTISVRVTLCSGLSESAGQQLISVYPNPSSGTFNISSDTDLQLQIVDMTGRLVAICTLDITNNRSFTLQGLSAGTYFVTAKEAGFTKKLVVLQ